MVANRAVLNNVGVRGIAAALAFVSQIVLVKLLGEESYGSYVLFITYCSLIFIFSRSGLDIVALRTLSIAFGRSNKEQFLHVLKRAMLLALLFSICWSIAFSELNKAGILGHFLYISIELGWTLGSVMAMTLLAILLSGIRSTRSNINADIIDSIFKPTIIIISTWILSEQLGKSTNIGYIAFIAANLTVMLVAAIFLMRVTRSHNWLDRKPSGEGFELLNIKSTSIFITYALITYVFFQLDTLLVGTHLGAVEAGAYNMACNFVRLVIFIPLIIVAQMQPGIATQYDSRNILAIKLTVIRAMKLSLISAITSVIFLAAAGRQLLSYVSESYEDSYPTLILLSFTHLLNTVCIVIAGALFMCKAQRIVVSSQVAGLFVCLSLLLICTPKFGAVGAAASVLLGILMNLVVLLILSKQWLRREELR